jgi:hypothetical protein
VCDVTKHDDPFIRLPHAVYDSPAFATIKAIDIAVLLLLIRKHNGHNNGTISLGLREISRRCHCSLMTAARALDSLQKASLISLTYKGHLVPEFGRPDAASRWRLNFVTDASKPKRASKSGNSRVRDTQVIHRGDTVARHH